MREAAEKIWMMITQENGRYEWNGTVDVSYEHKVFKILFIVIGAVCVLFIIMALVMGGDMLGVILLSDLGVMSIVGGVCFLFNLNAGKRKQAYTMTEDCIIFGVGRAQNPFYFRSIRKAVVYTGRNMIELYTLIGSGPVFVDHNEFGFVRDYILRRLPETAEVVYD